MERETRFVDSAFQAAKNTVKLGTQDKSIYIDLGIAEFESKLKRGDY